MDIKSKKGITLTSLIIYIIVVLIVLGMLAVIMANLQSNITGVGKEGTKNAEIDKFNLYFLKEVKKQGNGIKSISNDKKEIEFTTENSYLFDSKDKSIYLKDKDEDKEIKIAEKIEKCEFFNKIDNDKEIIVVKIKAKDAEERTIEYVLGVGELTSSYENENEYINLIPSNWDLSKLNIEKPVVIEKINGETYIAPIPRGFTVSDDPTENKIQNGLVIKDGEGNEFVWIPVPNISDMAVLQDGSSSDYRGVLYDWNTNPAG